MSDIVALITARGGSKRLPDKNLLPLAGKPLLAWTIEAARGARSVSRLLVSTDCPAIAAVASEYGAEVPFLRPAHLAQDDSPHIDVVCHALDWLQETAGQLPEYLLLLQPTSPLRTAADIDEAVEHVRRCRADALVSVCPAQHHPLLTRRITADGLLASYMDSPLAYPRHQDLPPAYALNGAIYLTRPAVLEGQRTFLPAATVAHVMPRERSIDIDHAWDLNLAQLILEDRWQRESSTSMAG